MDQLKAGDPIKVVVELYAADQSTLKGKVLLRQSDTHYTRMDKEAQIAWSGSTPIVMGKASNLRRGTVIHVTGEVTAEHGVRAQQIVILTGYVEVK